MGSFDASKVRNVGILGHGGTGKTILIEHILHAAGKTSRVGSIVDGSTHGDYLEDEIQRQQTLSMKIMTVDWEGTRVHLIDHPGYADFLGEVAATTAVVDSVVIVIDATTGPQVGSDNAFKYADQFNVPRAILVNKLDRDNTSFDETVAVIQQNYGPQCVPIIIPVGAAADLSGVVNILSDKNDELAGEIESLKEAMMEAVAETEDALTEKYLEEGELSEEEFLNGLRKGIRTGAIVPILACSADKDIGVKELMEFIITDFPAPLERKCVAVTDSGEEKEIEISADGPFMGQVFRSIVDPFVGQLTLFRVFSGTLKSDSDFYNVTTRQKERTGKIYFLCGKEQEVADEVGPGDIAAMAKLKNTHFGDTLGTPNCDVQFKKIELPDSMVKFAIVPKSRADEDKIGEALNKIAEEDPTFAHYRDTATNEHIIRGMGDVQLDVLLERMKKKYKVEAETHTPKVAYKESVKGKSDVQGKHKKQTGGHGQYGDVHLRISPNERGGGYKFIDSIVGGVVPRQYIPHVDKGCQDTLERGVLAGFPVVDVVVELHFGSYHDVDSSEMAFKLAAAKAIQEGVRQAKPFLLEPIMEIAITIPDEYMGDINGDLNSRRGRILGMEPAGHGRQRIKALVPEGEVLRYSAELRSITQGRGTYELKFDHYEEVPADTAQGIIAQYETARAEGE